MIKIGIVAEGRADQMVIRNILYAFDLDKKDILFIRPELEKDATDSVLSEKTFGSWTNVKNDCESKIPFLDFFNNQLIGNKLIVIHLDSDTCTEYGVEEFLNPKTSNDFSIFRNRIVTKIQDWLQNLYSEQLLYAICIRQIDAWILTLWATPNEKDTGCIAKPKNKLHSTEAYRAEKGKPDVSKYDLLSTQFDNIKKLNRATKFNQSLKDFVESIKTKLEELEKKED